MGDAEDSGRRWSCPLSLRATKKPRNHSTIVVAVARSRGMTRGNDKRGLASGEGGGCRRKAMLDRVMWVQGRGWDGIGCCCDDRKGGDMLWQEMM